MLTELDISPGFISDLIYTQMVYPPLESRILRSKQTHLLYLLGL